MTTLYRPVLIESVEQAQSMPGATLFVGIDGARYDHRGDGRLRDHDGTDMAIDLAGGKPVTALVPVEVVEVEQTATGHLEPSIHAGSQMLCTDHCARDRTHTRTSWHTRWERMDA